MKKSMKKFIFLIVIIFQFLSLALFGSTIEYKYYFKKPQITKQGDYYRIERDGLMSISKPGEPELPSKSVQLLLLPGEQAVSISIIYEGRNDLPGEYRIYPRQRPYPIGYQGEVEFTEPNPEIYNSNKPFPEKLHSDAQTQYLRGHSIAILNIFPVQYKPASGKVSYFSEMRVLIETEPTVEAENSFNNFYRHDKKTNERVRNIVHNPEQIRLYPSQSNTRSGDNKYVIITSSTYSSYFDSFVDFKTKQGYNVLIKTTNDIYSEYSGVDNQDKIRNFIKYAYENLGTEYVLLGGDVEIVPHRGFWIDTGDGIEDYDIPADLYYAALDRVGSGSGPDWNVDNDDKWGETTEADYYAEVYIGRISADTGSEFNAALNKQTMYQQSPVVSDLEKAIMAGEQLDDDPLTWGGTYKDEIMNGGTYNGYTTTGFPINFYVETQYERVGSWSWTDLRDKMNAGTNIINHHGHSNPNFNMKFLRSYVTNSNLTSNGTTHNFYIIYTQGCTTTGFDNRWPNGWYDPEDCIAEKFTTISNGCVAFIGNSRYGWYLPGGTDVGSQYLDRQFFDALFGENIYKLGEMNEDSKEDGVSQCDSDPYFRWSYYCLNLLGDPSLDVWTDAPATLAPTYAGSIEITDTQLYVSVGISGALVGLSQDGNHIGSGITDVTGNVTVIFDNSPSVGTMDIYITAHNYNIHTGTISVSGGSAFEPPTNLSVTELGYATWEAPSGGDDFYEDFEGTFPPDGWLKLNPDGGTGWEPLELGTTPLPGWGGGEATACPDGGNWQAYATWTTGGAGSNDQWLVTPQITVQAGDMLDFWMIYYINSYMDHVEVLISTTVQNNTAAFDIVVAEIDFPVGSPTNWTQYTYNLTDFVAAGTSVYIAFREMVADNLNDGSAISIDNVLVGTPAEQTAPVVHFEQPLKVTKNMNYVHVPATHIVETRELTGYKVYLDGVYVDFTTNLFWQYTGLTSGVNYTAGVSALYDEGESNIIEVPFTYIQLTADFTADVTSGIAPLTVNFTDLSTGDPISWEWDFDYDSIVDSYEQNPTWIYNEPGLYTVSLTVSDGSTSDTETKTDYIDVRVNIPDANFKAAINDSLGQPPDYNPTVADLNGITGELDASNAEISSIEGAQYLTNLTWLYLYYNQISDISTVSGLTNLTQLSLSYNQISDISAVSGLTNLTRLYLRSNQISDISAVSGLTNLTWLSLDNNQISDISAVSGLTNLTNLGLHSNQISNISAVSGLPNLTYLNYNENQISDISAVSGLTNLTYLGLRSNQISGISAVSSLINLTILRLNSNQISDISVVSGLTNLTRLYLSSNQIIDISAVSGLTNLTDLGLRSNQISDISAVSGLTNLTELSLYSNQISDISALVENTGLGSGDELLLEDNGQSNPLSQEALNVHIPILESRGFDVLQYSSTPNNYAACYPNPSRNEIGVSTNTDLEWSGNFPTREANYDVWLGETSENLVNVGNGVAINDTLYSFSPTLNLNTDYWWKVRAVTTTDTIWSGLWHFTTGEGISLVANFSADVTSGTAPLTVNFTDLSTGSPTTWEWDFQNDGTIDSYIQNPEWTYNDPGLYTVSLTISDGTNTDTETKVDYINVYEHITLINIPDDYPTIQGGINAAIDADTVLVQPGAYVENINFNGKNITVASLFLTTLDTTYISQTIINGNHSGRVVSINSGEELTALLTGFTITNGYASGDWPNDSGAGVFIDNSSPTISYCIISGNSADGCGAGITWLGLSSPIISNCTISWNSAPNSVAGGILCQSSEMANPPLIENCTIESNSANSGAGVYLRDNTTLKRCLVINNTAVAVLGSGGNGGGFYCYENSPTIENCTISGNSADNSSGAIRLNSVTLTMINTIVEGNFGNEGIHFLNASSSSFTYCDFYNNQGGDFGGEPPAGLGTITGVNANGDPCDEFFNIFLDPLFASTRTDSSYYLTESSPCIDAGDPSSPLDPDGTIADMGAFYFDQFTLSAPENLIIYTTSDSVFIEWDAVPGASFYTVYSSDNPYSSFPDNWTLIEYGIETTSWSYPLSGDKKFFRVTANN